MSDKQAITEEQNVQVEWYAAARDQAPDTLPAFFAHVMGDYVHDYGTVCHAIAACAVATAWAMNSHEGARGGITGFQAGAVMWGFIRAWQSLEEPLRLVQYSDLLYPQYAHKYDQTISPDTWAWLQKRAAELLAADGDRAHPNVADHWRSIVAGVVPFGYRVEES